MMIEKSGTIRLRDIPTTTRLTQEEQELAAGSLVELSDQVLTSTDAYYLVYPEARAQTPLVKAFRDWVVAECAAQQQRAA